MEVTPHRTMSMEGKGDSHFPPDSVFIKEESPKIPQENPLQLYEVGPSVRPAPKPVIVKTVPHLSLRDGFIFSKHTAAPYQSNI